ncbi:hypothetical protein Leryth_002823, partial [Lithospermum erythrorhizon]
MFHIIGRQDHQYRDVNPRAHLKRKEHFHHKKCPKHFKRRGCTLKPTILCKSYSGNRSKTSNYSPNQEFPPLTSKQFLKIIH